MKRRVRKKLHLREFAEYGVELELKVTREMDNEMCFLRGQSGEKNSDFQL